MSLKYTVCIFNFEQKEQKDSNFFAGKRQQ